LIRDVFHWKNGEDVGERETGNERDGKRVRVGEAERRECDGGACEPTGGESDVHIGRDRRKEGEGEGGRVTRE